MAQPPSPRSLPRIVQAGHPALRQQARPLTAAEIVAAPTQELVQTMVAAMRAAPGVGLAAPQLGLGLQLIVVEDRPDYVEAISARQRAATQRAAVPLMVIFNPTLEVHGDVGEATHREGCLSVRGYSAEVGRHLAVTVRGLDAAAAPVVWEARGWPARIAQHEVDHLAGTLYVDRMLSRTLRHDDEP